MRSIGAKAGPKHTVCRATIFKDLIDLYNDGAIVNEYPIFMAYSSENAIDDGGVTRDVFCAFWEEAYRVLFEGSTVLIPLIHPSTDLNVFPILGKIISHGYFVSGMLPLRICCPTLLGMLLGTAFDIPRSFLLDSLLDFVSGSERNILRSALQVKVSSTFSDEVQSSVISILSQFGCRESPTPANLPELIMKVAKYEFSCKPIAAITMVHSGIPETHKQFWRELGIDGISSLFSHLAVTPEKVLSIITCVCENPAQERVLGYLRTMIGNMNINDLRNFLRFTTGSSVCVAQTISVYFNTSHGFGRHPFANTCSNSLTLPVSYLNYQDFFDDWSAVLSDTDSQWKWCMDSH